MKRVPELKRGRRAGRRVTGSIDGRGLRRAKDLKSKRPVSNPYISVMNRRKSRQKDKVRRAVIVYGRCRMILRKTDGLAGGENAGAKLSFGKRRQRPGGRRARAGREAGGRHCDVKCRLEESTNVS